MSKIKKLTYSALLTAMAIIIPIQFSFLKVQIGPFTATLASHVPMFLSMLLGPFTAVMVGFGSTLGFLMTSPAFIAARAASHIVVGLIGSLLINRGVSFRKTVLITSPIHAIIEAMTVMPFGFTMYKVLVVIGVGTFIHHLVDGTISYVIIKAMAKNLKAKFVQDVV
jgi:niacin transporter